MEVIKPSYKILTPIDQEAIYALIEQAGRTAYKSEDKITIGSAEKFIASIIKRGHESVLEHFNISVRFICDRGITHEIVRHRLVSYTQESTRYCNYGKRGMTVIQPLFFKEDSKNWSTWIWAMQACESAYNALLESGASPQEARSVLPNSLKTEIVCTANIREWRHILKLRTSKAAHPQMREIMQPLLNELLGKLPALFADLEE